MAIPPELLEDLKARLNCIEIVGRRVKLVRSGRDTKGLCPFHKEKTPSFHVYDDHYHCFGCGEHGSAIDFVMNTESLQFPEAVRKLAGEAGLAMPEDTPADRERRQRNKTLAEAVEMAAAFFEKSLHMPEGQGALAYLKDRGFTDAIIRRFRLGFSPDGRGAMKAFMNKQGVDDGMLLGAGLLVQPEDQGREPYDRFRGRVMFPITDRQGKTIAFGARLLNGDGPKYLNSPETSLFHKGRNLYGLAQAKDAIREAGTVIVTEGYTDVIALAQAGVGHGVAPLGTALTEDQIGLLWRLVPEPVLCFDGDDAGQRAATRAAERALPMLKSGFGLRFAMLPRGEDPDSLVKNRGKAAFLEVLEGAAPLSELIWRVESGGRLPDTPEGRADLNARLDKKMRDIPDPTVRRYFQDFFKSRLWPAGERRAGPGQGRQFGRQAGRAGWQRDNWPGAQRLRAGSADTAPVDRAGVRTAILLATAINHPELLSEVDEDLGLMAAADGDLDNLRQALLITLANGLTLDTEGLKNHLSDQGHSKALSRLLSARTYDHARFARPEASIAEARLGWEATINHLRGEDLRSELQAAQDAVRHDPSEANLERVAHVRRMMNEAEGLAEAFE
ncbi:MAG: DNA primase [Rhodospirillaceae bacterium]